MRAYKPASTPEKVPFVPRHIDTVFRPIFLKTKRQRAAWVQESREWSRKLAEKMADETSLACYKRLWSVSLFGLIVSGFLFLILFTNAVRERRGDLLGSSTRCDYVPSIADLSTFSIVFWTAVVVDLISKLAAILAVTKMETLSKALHKADAAYYTRLNYYQRVGFHAGAAMATVPLFCGFVLMVRGKCEGELCLNLGLSPLAVVSWTLLVSIIGAQFPADGRMAILGGGRRISTMLLSKKERREVAVKSDCELLGEGEQDTVGCV